MFRFAVETVSKSELDFSDDDPIGENDEAARDAMRELKKKGQKRRIPVSLYNEVVGEYDLFRAMNELDFKTIEVVRCLRGALSPEIKAAVKASAKFPIRDHKHPRAVRDALKMIEYGVHPTDELLEYLEPLIECVRS